MQLLLPHTSCHFLAALGFFLTRTAALLQRSHVGDDELGVDDLDVADGIDRTEFVNDVVVLEAADDLNDGIDIADVAEELVAESCTFAGPFDETRDIDKLDGAELNLLRVSPLTVKPPVRRVAVGCAAPPLPAGATTIAATRNTAAVAPAARPTTGAGTLLEGP